jgi:hypothetical protein
MRSMPITEGSMKRLILGITAVVALAQVPSFAASRTETQPYAVGGTIFKFCDGGHKEIANVNDLSVEGDVPNLGGGCFSIKPGDATITISITNDLADRVGGEYQFEPVPSTVSPEPIQFCGNTSMIVVPSWAEVLYVDAETTSANVDVAGTPVGVLGACSSPASVAAHGTISVTFSS